MAGTACAWIGLITVVFCLPISNPGTSETLNYTVGRGGGHRTRRRRLVGRLGPRCEAVDVGFLPNARLGTYVSQDQGRPEAGIIYVCARRRQGHLPHGGDGGIAGLMWLFQGLEDDGGLGDQHGQCSLSGCCSARTGCGALLTVWRAAARRRHGTCARNSSKMTNFFARVHIA